MLNEIDTQRGARLAELVHLERVSDPLRFAALRAEWGELIGVSGASIFNAWEWLYPWYRRIGSQRTPWILTAREAGGRLAGLWALSVEERSVAGRAVRRLGFLGDEHVGSDYLDIVARPGFETIVTRAFTRALQDARGEWDVLELLDLDEASPTRDAVIAMLAESGCPASVEERFVCPCERLQPGMSFDDFLKGKPRRDNFLRRLKWFERQRGYRLDVVAEPERVPRALADFFRLHALRWEAEGGSQGIKGTGVQAFHRDAAQLLAERGKLRMFTLRLGEEALASVYGILDRGRFLYYQSGYDPAWRNKSAGLVLVGETFRTALQAGVREYEFLRGTEVYKRDWTTQERKTVAVRAWQPGAGSWFVTGQRLSKRARNALKAVLPAAAVERIRRARRQRAAIH